MLPNILPLAILGLAGLAKADTATSDWGHSGCQATPNWPGWAGIKYAFVFGDSYTTTQFNYTLTQPTPTNPLGNPTYPGYTASNGPNWVDVLTTKYNSSLLLTYNLAYGGATIDSSIVAPYLPTVSSISEQVLNEFFPNYAIPPSTAPWTSSDTLFLVFDGINDVGNTFSKGANVTTHLNSIIFGVYAGLVDSLYYIGARNFAFLNVPPVDRAPLVSEQGTAAQALEKADIADWNARVTGMAQALKKMRPDTNVFTVDANKLFTEVLDNPKSYPQTSGYANLTEYCVAYENGTPAENSFNASCGVPVNEYFWLNSLHPTYPMQDVLGQGVAKQLEAGPNIC